MKILFLNPYHGGSHAAVANGYAAHTRHHLRLLTLPTSGGWRWRMRGAAVTLARMAREDQPTPDLILTTDMLDLATFCALTSQHYGRHIPTVVYFHENQLTYPLPDHRTRDLSFAWTNYTSALVADAVVFNSAFHQRSFLHALPGLLNRYHDYTEPETIPAIAAKAAVLPPGIDLQWHDQYRPAEPRVSTTPPVILWNSRWDYDKQPAAFFAALEELEEQGAAFGLIVAGEHIDPHAPEFVAARARWDHRLLHWGYAADPADYSRLLHRADIVVSTALQEFFGIGIIEALYCGCIPVLPHRLTYPDMLPTQYHADCLYTTADELVGCLKRALQHCADLRQRDWQSLAAPFDWSQLAPRYDTLLEEVGSSRTTPARRNEKHQ